ncbi:MAG: protein kinase family protein [Bacillus sp. (in: firmicutes)]
MYEIYANSVEFAFGFWGDIQVRKNHEDLMLIGTGRSACVFLIKDTNKVIKIFHPKFQHIAYEEADIYSHLTQIPQFPTIYQTGTNYIVMDYIEGYTLFDCLHKGIKIQEEQVNEVDDILQLVRSKGLNPSDVHLRNILVTADRQVKIIDVARFKQTKSCQQWDDLKGAYFQLYIHPLFPRKLPKSLLNIIGILYKKKLIPFYARQ